MASFLLCQDCGFPPKWLLIKSSQQEELDSHDCHRAFNEFIADVYAYESLCARIWLPRSWSYRGWRVNLGHLQLQQVLLTDRTVIIIVNVLCKGPYESAGLKPGFSAWL